LRGGLARFNEGVIAVYGYKEGLLNSSVQSLAADRSGNIWIGTLEGLYLLRSGQGIIRPVSDTSYTPITSLVEDNLGNLWIATMADGLKRMTGDTLTGLSTDQGLPDDFIRCLLIDRDENLWIGTDRGGLVQLRNPLVRTITGDHGISESAVSAVMMDRRGFLWIGTRNSGLCRMKDSRVIETFDAQTGIFSNKVRILFEDSDGNLWVGTEDSGLAILRNGQWNRINSESGLRSNNVMTFFQDRKGTIWIGTDKGLDRFRDGKLGPPGAFAGLAGYQVRALLESGGGLLLAGTSQGLFKITEKTVEKIELTRTDSEPEIVSLYEDSEGILWIGTNGDGLLRWVEGKTTAFTTAEGLRDNYIYSLAEDGYGNLWMSTNRGVMRISLKRLNDYAGGKIRYLVPAFYDEAEGMASSQCSGEGQPSVWKDGTGRLYFPTGKGIAVFDPAKIAVRPAFPRTIIEAVLCDGKPVESDDVPCFPHRSETLEFHFTALDFRAPEKIRFKYRLEGYEEEFVCLPLDAERAARYVNLSPGEYRFMVHAASNDGVWDENGAFFAFEVLLSFFQKPAFTVLVVLAVLLAAGTVLLINRQRKQKRRRDKYKTIPIDSKRIEDIIAKLLHLMDEERLFLDPDLTLNKLSLRLRIHYNHLSRIINERFGLSYNDFINKYRVEEARKKLTAIVPGPDLRNSAGESIPTAVIYVLLAVALLVVLSAAFNYTNLSTAQALSRAREVGIRKVIGARRYQIFLQFIGESVTMALLAFILAFVFYRAILIPLFFSLHDIFRTYFYFAENWTTLGYFLLFAVGTGIAAGIIPAIHISRFQPVQAMRNLPGLRVVSRISLRKGLIVFQSALSVVFIISTLVAVDQLNYIRKTDPGMRTEGLITVSLEGVDYGIFKQKVVQDARVRGIAGTEFLPGTSSRFGLVLKRSDAPIESSVVMIDSDAGFIPVFGLQIVAGSNFPDTASSSKETLLVLNETAVKELEFGGPQDAVGRSLLMKDGQRIRVAGVVKDFAHFSVTRDQGASALRFLPEQCRVAVLHVEPAKIKDVAASLQQMWGSFESAAPFEYALFADQIEDELAGMKVMLKSIRFVSILTVIISCLGFLGIADYSSRIRRKEIGIRKVCGAGEWSLVKLLSRNFMGMLAVATAPAIPLAWWFNGVILSLYDKKVGMRAELFIIGACLVMVLGMGMVLSQTIRAARTNPVDIIRYE
jgi:AraC-like DNA-binding protein/streptogramin lyase